MANDIMGEKQCEWLDCENHVQQIVYSMLCKIPELRPSVGFLLSSRDIISKIQNLDIRNEVINSQLLKSEKYEMFNLDELDEFETATESISDVKL